MAELVPLSLEQLVTRMERERAAHDAIFDLPLARCFFGSPDHDLSVRFHGRRVASPLGPAAGPHSQMAQNIALAWLGGSRIIELKTVQVDDELVIPRPCIDMRTVGYNIEWSQELKLEQSAEEYVKGAMLVEMLKAALSGRLVPGFGETTFDMSVGYDLAGIQSPRVRRFIETMRDASPLVERLRGELPATYAAYRDLPFPTRLSDTLTLSTFHGCPPDEIERILEHLLREHGLHVIVKLNPMLLGPEEVDHLLHDVLGYESIRVPRTAFARDTTWEQACGFVERLRTLAQTLGLGFGIKLTNTLIVEHPGDFLPAGEGEKYLSGPPLHVLAMRLVARFRERFGRELPISFSAGIDRHNVADAVGLGLVPVTVCSDLLREGGYARQATYFRNLLRRMDDAGVTTIDALVRASDDADAYVSGLLEDERYRETKNRKPPAKIGSTLALFDCITCDKCIPVCPNDANFALPIAPAPVPVLVCVQRNGVWSCEERGSMTLDQKHQIGNFADVCNDCGNCDVFCPEDGGPYVVKPRFFGSDMTFDDAAAGNGFVVREVGDDTHHVRGRFEAGEFTIRRHGSTIEYGGAGFAVSFTIDDPAATIAGEADDGVEVDLSYALLLDLLGRGVLEASAAEFMRAW